MEVSKYHNCIFHPENKLEFFCTCEKTLCYICIGKHENHDNFLISKLDNLEQIFLNDIKEFVKFSKGHFMKEQITNKEVNLCNKTIVKSIEEVNKNFFENLFSNSCTQTENIISNVENEINEIKRQSCGDFDEHKMFKFVCKNYPSSFSENYIKKKFEAEIKKRNINEKKEFFLNDYKKLLEKYFSFPNEQDYILQDNVEEKIQNKKVKEENLAFSFFPQANLNKNKKITFEEKYEEINRNKKTQQTIFKDEFIEVKRDNINIKSSIYSLSDNINVGTQIYQKNNFHILEQKNVENNFTFKNENLNKNQPLYIKPNSMTKNEQLCNEVKNYGKKCELSFEKTNVNAKTLNSTKTNSKSSRSNSPTNNKIQLKCETCDMKYFIMKTELQWRKDCNECMYSKLKKLKF